MNFGKNETEFMGETDFIGSYWRDKVFPGSLDWYQ